MDLLTAYQHSAVVAAASLTGIAETMYAGERDAPAIADRLDLNERAVRSLIGAMVALGLAEAADGGHVLTETGGPLARSHPETIHGVVGKEWFFYGVWNGLPEAMVDGHARIAPWRERLANNPDQALGFLAALDDLASMFGGELPGLAGIEGGGRMLDVGGGAGSHAERLADAVDGLEVTVLDLPEVRPLAAERHPSVPFITGDLEQPRFGLAEGEQWDALLLANILHDHDAERCRQILGEARGLLRPGGTLLLYEWVLNDDRDSPAPVALFDLMMMVENEGGAAWTEGGLRSFLSDAGFSGFEVNRGFGPIAAVKSTA
jgi:SAM-dependent methyltransferase